MTNVHPKLSPESYIRVQENDDQDPRTSLTAYLYTDDKPDGIELAQSSLPLSEEFGGTAADAADDYRAFLWLVESAARQHNMAVYYDAESLKAFRPQGLFPESAEPVRIEFFDPS